MTAMDPVVLRQGLRALAEHHMDIPRMDVLSIVDVLLHEVRTGARYEAWEHITSAYQQMWKWDGGFGGDVDHYGPWTCPREEAVRAVTEQLHAAYDEAITAAVALHEAEVAHRV